MERVGTLLNKLKEQFEQQASPEKMAVTAQLLLAELQQQVQQTVAGNKVSVVLPTVHKTISPASIPEKEETKTIDTNWLFAVSEDIPTIVHQEIPVKETGAPSKKPLETTAPAPEFNTLFAVKTESLNEKLKEERVEVAAALQTAPIRDLKKAIGVNDRFLFVNDLFRGDENMYERSLKTINSFTIYPEAEYWIQRELKVKLSWPDESESVRLFDQLVRRRFA